MERRDRCVKLGGGDRQVDRPRPDFTAIKRGPTMKTHDLVAHLPSEQSDLEMCGSSWVPLIFVFSLIIAAFGQNNLVDAQPLDIEYVKALEKLENDRYSQFRQLLSEQQLGQEANSRVSPLTAFLTANVQTNPQRVAKRAPGSHHIQQRAISQFKNCYFSPVQCVLLERRRRASFA